MGFLQNLLHRPARGHSRELWPASGIHRPVDPIEEQAFEAHCQKRFARLGRIGSWVTLFVTFAWWPVDLLIYRHVTEASGPPFIFRFSALSSSLFFLLLPHRNPLFLRHVFWLLVLPVCFIMAGLGYSGGALGGLARPWSWMALPAMCSTIMFPLTLSRRILMVALQGLAWLGGLFLFWPQNLQSPYLAVLLSMLVLVGVYGLMMGHYMTVLLRDNFRQSLALAHSTEELETKVAEKTQALRELLSQLERAREEERARISRDLHDELGQELTALRYALGLTQERFRRDAGTIGRNLGELDHLLQRTNRTVRSLVSQLRPVILDDLGLKAATEWLLQRSHERTGLVCQARLEGDDSRLPGELASTVFRIIQESLTNVMRHASAGRVEVELSISAPQLVLRVRDDGVGFAVDRKSAGRSGVGLLGMRERALALGANLHIHSRPGHGTTVEAVFPLSAVADPAGSEPVISEPPVSEPPVSEPAISEPAVSASPTRGASVADPASRERSPAVSGDVPR